MLSAFAVLRRAATPEDKPRGGLFPNGPPPFARDVYIRYVRRAQYHFGGGYYLIPAGNVQGQHPVEVLCRGDRRIEKRAANDPGSRARSRGALPG